MDSRQISATVQSKVGALRSQRDLAAPHVVSASAPSDRHQPFLHWITLLLWSLLQHRVGSGFNIGSGCLWLYSSRSDGLVNGQQTTRRRNLSSLWNHKELNVQLLHSLNPPGTAAKSCLSSPPPVRDFYVIMSLQTNKEQLCQSLNSPNFTQTKEFLQHNWNNPGHRANIWGSSVSPECMFSRAWCVT